MSIKPDLDRVPATSEAEATSTRQGRVDTEAATDKKSIQTASQGKLMWRAFRRNKLAVAGGVVVIAIYLVALFADFLAPAAPGTFNSDYLYAPPQRVHVVSTDSAGERTVGLHVLGYVSEMDPDTYAITYEPNPDDVIEMGFFVEGDPYRFLGLFDSSTHLFGPVDAQDKVFLLGADSSGRDVLSRLIHGARISMTVGLLGVAFAFVLGVLLGGISGYFGGKVDTVIQRLVELFMSIPTLPLWLGLAAALPRDMTPLTRYFAITVILAIVAWTDLARVTRGRFLSLRQEEFVTAAHLDGNRLPRVLFRHMLPSFSSHLIASLTLSIPGMILAETSLSFLGVGLQAPIVSWGVLLQDAQNIRAIATAPWLMAPGAAVVIAVLALNFVGDGLRDAADPYSQ